MAPELRANGVASFDADSDAAPADASGRMSMEDVAAPGESAGSTAGSTSGWPTAGRPTAGGPPRWRRLVVLLLAPVLASLAVLVVAGGRLDAPFSPAFSGFNTAVWSSGSQAVRAHGWWDTRLGATAGPSGADVPYAHHPPLVRVEVAVAESALGEHRWVDRLPALLSSLAAIWLCWGWLGACGFSPGPRSFGVLATAGTAFFLTYGVMLNMEAIWLPSAFALLWAWQRAERRGGGCWTCGALALVGCTAAHQGILLAGGLSLWAIVAAVRARRRPRPHELGVIAATVAGTALFVVWVVWASGGLSDLERIARQRTGGGVTWAEFFSSQVTHTLSVFGLLGIVCAAAGVLLVRRRPTLVGPLVVLWGVGLAYAFGFREGAVIHEYWNVALVPAVALGAALLADRLGQFGPRVVPGICVAAALLMFGAALGDSRDVGGDGAGQLARTAGERGAPVLYSTEIVSDWITYESGGPAKAVYSCPAVRRLAARDGDAPVLTSARWIEQRRAGGWTNLVGVDGVVTTPDGYALTTATEVASAC